MQVGDIITTDVYGHRVEVKILAIRPFGTIDVERLSDGRYFRISGLTW